MKKILKYTNIFCIIAIIQKIKLVINIMPRKEQLQPVRNEASLQADGTYTTNSRFDKYINTEIHKNTNKQQITSLTNTQIHKYTKNAGLSSRHPESTTTWLSGDRSFDHKEFRQTRNDNYIQLHYITLNCTK